MMNTTDKFYIKDGVLISYNGKDSHVIVPSTVRVIASFAFNTPDVVVKEITLPSSVKAISSYAFGNGIEKINFSEGLEYIGKGAISGCTNLQPLKYPKSLKYIGYLHAGEGGVHPFKYENMEFVVLGDGVLRGYNGTNTTITLPNTVKVMSILEATNKDTVKLVIPESVKVLEGISVHYTQIGSDYRFALKDVYFPASINEVADDFYLSVKWLKISGGHNNVNFHVKKGSFMESVLKFYEINYKYY